MREATAADTSAARPWLLLTGATGVLGSYLLHELLSRGHRVACLVRADSDPKAHARLSAALVHWQRDIVADVAAGSLRIICGDLHQPQLGLSAQAASELRGSITTAIHAAGCTVFQQRADGEPARTNVAGARALFRFAHECGCRDWHLVSTAYVCGSAEHGFEEFHERAPAFRNAYEHSKWNAEQENRAAAERCGATLTVYRPGVIVGHSESGAITGFTGIYYLFRAIALLGQAAAQYGDAERRRIPLCIPADALARPNLICIDDAARELVDIFERPEARGGVFHLTHPKPPSNRLIKRVLERCLDVGGGRFVGAVRSKLSGSSSAYDQMFAAALGAVTSYVLESPRFDRTRTDRFVARPPAPWNTARLARLIAFAQQSGWRGNGRAAATHGAHRVNC